MKNNVEKLKITPCRKIGEARKGGTFIPNKGGVAGIDVEIRLSLLWNRD